MTNIEPYSFDVGNQCFDCIYSKWIYVGCETCFVKTKNKRHIDRYCPEAPIEHIERKTECPNCKSEIEDLKAERDRWHVLANNLQDARVGDLILREELQAVIDKLPKTADCVAVIPGSSHVWKMTNGQPEQSVNWKGWAAQFVSDFRDTPEWTGGHDPSKCYSSREAILQSQAKKDEAFQKHLDNATRIVDSWPEWKKNMLGEFK